MPQIDGVELSYSFGTAWQPLPGRATHLAIGANGAAFHVGTTKLGAGGFELAYWTGSGWQRFSGYAEAVQVAVAPDGTPWHVNAQGLIYRWSGNHWSPIPGRARIHPIQPAATGTTLAIGADGSVFHVGTTKLGAGGFDLNHWNGSGWDRVAGTEAVQVAVAPNGFPWHVNAKGEIFRWIGHGWQQIPGKATHLAIGRDGSVYHVGTTPGINGYNIARWNGGSGWDDLNDAAGILIAVEPTGRPWYVNGSLNIFRGAFPHYPSLSEVINDFARYSDPDGCMALKPGSTASPSTDNSTLFTAEKLVVIGPTRNGELEWFRGHILSCMDPHKGFIRHPNKREPTSYDDLIGAFAFLKKYNYINDARALHKFMDQHHWNNKGYFPQLRGFSKMCENEDPGGGGLLDVKLAFLANQGLEVPIGGARLFAEPKNETSGKCLLYLMTRIIEGHGHIWQGMVDDWHKFIIQTYGQGQMREVYKIYFGADHRMTKYAKPW